VLQTVRQLTAEDLEIMVDGSTLVKCVTDIGSQPFADLIQNVRVAHTLFLHLQSAILIIYNGP